MITISVIRAVLCARIIVVKGHKVVSLQFGQLQLQLKSQTAIVPGNIVLRLIFMTPVLCVCPI